MPQMSIRARSALNLALAIAGLAGCDDPPTTPTDTSGSAEASAEPIATASASAVAAAPPASIELSPAGKAFVDGLISSGKVQKVEVPDKFPHVVITDAFLQLPPAEQEKLVQELNGHYLDASPAAKNVVLKDASGKTVGLFNPALGLRLN